jgi:hypothetical protein
MLSECWAKNDKEIELKFCKTQPMGELMNSSVQFLSYLSVTKLIFFSHSQAVKALVITLG